MLKSFHKLFLFDSGDVVDVAMFNKVGAPLVDMLGGYKYRSEEGYKEMVRDVVCCLVQLAVVVNSDLLWKTLNHHVLTHTRFAVGFFFFFFSFSFYPPLFLSHTPLGALMPESVVLLWKLKSAYMIAWVKNSCSCFLKVFLISQN